MTYKYIELHNHDEGYKIWNKVYKMYVGEIRNDMLFQYPDCGFSNGCIREISKSIDSFFGKKETPLNIEIQKHEEIYKIWDTELEKYVGEIRRERMGQWMHYQLFQYPDCGLFNSCLKEITKFITTLYGRKKNG